MRVQGEIFDCKLSWGSHIIHISNFVKKEDANYQEDLN
jgi:hypothetical protein